MQPTAILDRPAVNDPANAGLEASAAPRDSNMVGNRTPAPLLVAVDGSATSTRQLVWALQEAARREAVVLAVAVVDPDADAGALAAARTLLHAQLRHAIGQTGVHGPARTALLDPTVYEALTATASGTDLVMVGPHRKTVLRPATRPPLRRPLTRCA